MRKQRGFSLIELLIVVAIILIIAAIAIPNLMSARIAANETSAVGSARQISTGQTTYEISYGTYADNLSKLGGVPGAPPTPAGAQIIDWVLGCAAQPCIKSGYSFSIGNPVVNAGRVVSFEVWAVPVSNNTGKRSFCVDQLSSITVDPTASNPPVCTAPLN